MSQVPCLLPGQHRGELLHSCRVCASELIEWDPTPRENACRRHAGQERGTCGPCAGERKGATPEPPRPTPGVGVPLGLCRFGLRHRVGKDGPIQCALCRRAAAPSTELEETR